MLLTKIKIGLQASAIVTKGLAMLAKLTPTKKDDKAVGKIRKAVTFAQKVLSYPALNPKR